MRGDVERPGLDVLDCRAKRPKVITVKGPGQKGVAVARGLGSLPVGEVVGLVAPGAQPARPDVEQVPRVPGALCDPFAEPLPRLDDHDP